MSIHRVRGESHLPSQSITLLWSAVDLTSALFTLRDLQSGLENLSRPQESFLLCADQGWRISSLWEQWRDTSSYRQKQHSHEEVKERSRTRTENSPWSINAKHVSKSLIPLSFKTWCLLFCPPTPGGRIWVTQDGKNSPKSKLLLLFPLLTTLDGHPSAAHSAQWD